MEPSSGPLQSFGLSGSIQRMQILTGLIISILFHDDQRILILLSISFYSGIFTCASVNLIKVTVFSPPTYKDRIPVLLLSSKCSKWSEKVVINHTHLNFT